MGGGAVQVEEFDFCVISTGMYSSNPNLPKVPGMEAFQGEILHSCTFKDKEQVRGKKVIVVGGGKSAVDNAVAAAKVGSSATLTGQFHATSSTLFLSSGVPIPGLVTSCSLPRTPW